MSRLSVLGSHAKPTLQRLSGPNEMPVTLAQVKANLNLNLDETTHDVKLSDRIAAATEQIEHDVDGALITQRFRYVMAQFPYVDFTFSIKPVQAIDEVRYLDTDGIEQTLDPSYYGFSAGQRLFFKMPGVSWPAVLQGHPEAVKIDFAAGYGTREQVPEYVKQGILLQVGKWWIDPVMESGTGYAEDRAYERIIDRLMRDTYP